MFQGRKFGIPCDEDAIRRAEQALGQTLPVPLRTLYLAFDGFLGPTDAAFLWPLSGNEGLVELNLFYRSDDTFPRELVSRSLFFGDNGCGAQWGFNSDLPGKIIQWDPSWGADFEIVGNDPVHAWRAEKELYEQAEE
jgi:cell wall assembly regulator SMI1